MKFGSFMDEGSRPALHLPANERYDVFVTSQQSRNFSKIYYDMPFFFFQRISWMHRNFLSGTRLAGDMDVLINRIAVFTHLDVVKSHPRFISFAANQDQQLDEFFFNCNWANRMKLLQPKQLTFSWCNCLTLANMKQYGNEIHRYSWMIKYRVKSSKIDKDYCFAVFKSAYVVIN